MVTSTKDVTVVIATRRRPESLARTLASLGGSDFPRDRFDVVVADNAGDPATRDACGAALGTVDVDYLVARGGGKSRALNRALERPLGELVLFTDDDVGVDPGWITSMWEGAGRWPEHQIFGGKVVPDWPESSPPLAAQTRYGGVAYSILDPGLSEGPSRTFMPFGPNLGLRRAVLLGGARFDPTLGPAPGSYTMGGETELLDRLRSEGHVPVFLPSSTVRHRIRPSQYSLRWLLGRARKYGRRLADRELRAREDGGDGAPGWLARGALEFGVKALWHAASGQRALALERAMDAAVEWGKRDRYRRR